MRCPRSYSLIISTLFAVCSSWQTADQRGVANGVSMAIVSLFKAIGPAIAGVLYVIVNKKKTLSSIKIRLANIMHKKTELIFTSFVERYSHCTHTCIEN